MAIEAAAAAFAQAELVYGHGTDNAWDEAVALVLGVTGEPDDRRVLAETLSDAQAARIESVVERRIVERLPLAYLLGKTRYVGLDFIVEPGLMIPRSPLAPLLLDHAEEWLERAPARVLDLCCGTGCLGIVAGRFFPDAEVTLVEVDPRACAVAEQNVALHGLAHRATVVNADVVRWVRRPPCFDLVLFNPPYVDAQGMAALPPDYRHEPRQGLAAGADGLAVALPVLDRTAALLAPEGLLLGEVGCSADALRRARPRLPLRWLDEQAEGVFLLPA